MDIEITTDARRFDIAAIHRFLSGSYWSPNIPRELVERAIANSLCFAALLDGEQVGFARAITDKATFAYLADVFVLQEHRRGRGLGLWLVETALGLPECEGARWLLGTRDAHGLYAQFGFEPVKYPERFMEIANPSPYKTIDGKAEAKV